MIVVLVQDIDPSRDASDGTQYCRDIPRLHARRQRKDRNKSRRDDLQSTQTVVKRHGLGRFAVVPSNVLVHTGKDGRRDVILYRQLAHR